MTTSKAKHLRILGGGVNSGIVPPQRPQPHSQTS